MSEEGIHRFENILVPKDHHFRITFIDGDVAVLTECEPTDIYLKDTSPRWTSVVVSCEHAPATRLHIYEPGHGLHFHEGDIQKIVDVSQQKIIYEGEI